MIILRYIIKLLSSLYSLMLIIMSFILRSLWVQGAWLVDKIMLSTCTYTLLNNTRQGLLRLHGVGSIFVIKRLISVQQYHTSLSKTALKIPTLALFLFLLDSSVGDPHSECNVKHWNKKIQCLDYFISLCMCTYTNISQHHYIYIRHVKLKCPVKLCY